MPDYIEVNSPLIQACGGNIFKVNLETIASQVITGDGSNVELRLKLLERALSGASATHFAGDIAARDAKTGVNPGDIVIVLDASADPTVESGVAHYMKLPDGTYLKTGEMESMDLQLVWGDIQGRPTSEPTLIDAAVAHAHGHANLEVLAALSDEDGKLAYRNKQVFPDKRWIVKATSVDELDLATLANPALVILENPPSCDCTCDDCAAAAPKGAQTYLYINGTFEPLAIIGSGEGIGISSAAFSVNADGMLVVDESQAVGLKFKIANNGFLEASNG